MTNTKWTEKYRPATLEGYVGNTDIIDKVKHWIEIQDVPDLLLYGPPGTGKTTLARIIGNSFDADVHYINASAENGIDVLRERITSIANTVSFSEWKIVILDEADGLTRNFQEAMRPVIEHQSGTTRFIFTANHPERISDALHSRLTEFRIEPPDKRSVGLRAKYILDTEGIKYEGKDIVAVVNKYYPDQRKIVGTLQRNSGTGTLVVDLDVLASTDYMEKIATVLRSGEPAKTAFTSIRQIIADARVRQFDELFRYLYDNLNDLIPDGKRASVLAHISEGQYRASIVHTDPEIQVAQMFVNILRDLKP